MPFVMSRKNRHTTKAQSAMEYLMTYGWAILIISVVLGTLFQMGIFNAGSLSPKAPPGSCRVFRTSGTANLEGACTGQPPKYVAQFDGVSSKVSINNNAKVQMNGAFTLSFWLYVRAISGTSCDGAFSQGNAGLGGTAWIVYYSCPGLVGPYFKRAYADLPWGGSAPVIGQWKYYTVTYDGSSELYFYANGAQTNHYSGEVYPTDNDISPLIIGRGDSYGSQEIANLQIYNTSLDAGEVQILYAEGIGGVPVTPRYLTGWWPLNGDSADYSGNNNNGADTMLTYTAQYGK